MNWALRLITNTFRFSKSKPSNYTALLGFNPGKPELYGIAFRHSSASIKGPLGRINNQRLEFLGDAILGAVVSDHIYRAMPSKNEGYLTQMRSKIVSRRSLNDLGHKLDLSRYIETNSKKPRPGEAIFGDALEALIGAIYIDKGYDHAQQFIMEKLFKNFLDLDELDQLTISYKSKLLEWSQKNKKDLRLDTQLNSNENSNRRKPSFTCVVFAEELKIAEGNGKSKKAAEEKACHQACNSLKLLDV
jgi:ribonuclease III